MPWDSELCLNITFCFLKYHNVSNVSEESFSFSIFIIEATTFKAKNQIYFHFSTTYNNWISFTHNILIQCGKLNDQSKSNELQSRNGMYINSDKDRNMKKWREEKVQKLTTQCIDGKLKSFKNWTRFLLAATITSRDQTSGVEPKSIKNSKLRSLSMIDWSDTDAALLLLEHKHMW